MQRQGLVQAFRQTAGRRLVPILQLMLERLAGGEGLVVLRTVVGALETRPPHRLLTRGQVTHHVLARVPWTPLHQGAVAEGVPHGRPEPLAAIYDHQKPLGNIEAPLDQGPEERGQHLLVLGVRLDQAQAPFVPRHRDAQRDDHRRLGARLAVQHAGHNVLPGEVPLLACAELRRAGLNARAGHRRPRQADRPGHRLGGRRVVAARDPRPPAPHHQVMDGAIAMPRVVRPPWNLARRDMANPGHAHRPARAGQPDRPGVAPMPAPAD